MKRFLVVLLVLIFFPCSLCLAEINKELSKFIYEIPVMEGMEEYGTSEGRRLRYGEDGHFEYAVSTVVFRSKEGINLSATKIMDYYQNHFVSLGFRQWPNLKAPLTGRFNSPDLVTKGKAHIRSQGHISFWIPEQGNSITFWIEQRRDFDFRDSLPVLEKIEKSFSIVSNEYSFSFKTSKGHVSDWPDYLLNECFVERIIAKVVYQKSEGGDLGDDGSYRFYFSIFPTNAHAEQWQKRIIEKVREINPHPNYFKDGLAFIPFVIDNVAIEYKGEMYDKESIKFRDDLLKELKTIK
ncbi:MAG: hypothetical protein KAS66_13985 [Candidatus Omnitrophica bacterium]|nr:hypothetical protein [Candidatus Omnitrophota bacterium]